MPSICLVRSMSSNASNSGDDYARWTVVVNGDGQCFGLTPQIAGVTLVRAEWRKCKQASTRKEKHWTSHCQQQSVCFRPLGTFWPLPFFFSFLTVEVNQAGAFMHFSYSFSLNCQIHHSVVFNAQHRVHVQPDRTDQSGQGYHRLLWRRQSEHCRSDTLR